MEEKDRNRLNEIEDELRNISQEREKLRDMKRDVRDKEDNFDMLDEMTLKLCNEIEETWAYNNGLNENDPIFNEQRNLISKGIRDRYSFLHDEFGHLDRRLSQLDNQEEELNKEKRRINNI